MKRTSLVLITALFALGCEDEPAKTAAAPTAPVAAPLVAQATAASSAAATTGGSTICRVYVTERDVAKAALDEAPGDTLAQSRVKTLDALVKETCN